MKLLLYIIMIVIMMSLVQATAIVIQCTDDSGCPKPLKEGCDDFFVSCSNVCIYNPNSANRVVCENEVVTIIKQWEKVQEQTTIPEGDTNVFTFSQNKLRTKFNFGSQIFTAEVPEFLCQSTYTPDSDYIYPPTPSNNCWETTVNFLNDFSLKNMETKSVNNYISLKYVASGTYITGTGIDATATHFNNNDWGNTFIFTITNGIELALEPENKYINKDTTKTIPLEITNNLPPNSLAFVKIKQIAKQTNTILQDVTYPVSLVQGINTIPVSINTANYGINEIDVQAFYTINADNTVYIKSDRIITSYNVVDELPDDTVIVIEDPETKEVPIWVWWAFGIGAAVLIMRRL